MAAQSSYALITGASTGIGKAIAEDLASRGYNVILVARGENALQSVADNIRTRYNVDAVILTADLSENHAAGRIRDFCIDNNYPVSILVNNAGYAVFGLFENMPLEEQLNMVQVNNIAMLSLSHIFIPLLKKQPKAWIMNIASTSAFQSVAGMSLYAASKALVITFTRGLQLELADSTNIHVCCVIPGPTNTNFMNRANMGALKEMAAKFEWPAEKVAKIAVKGMFAGAVEVIPGFANKASYIFIKLMPKRIAEKIAAGIYLKAIKQGKR